MAEHNPFPGENNTGHVWDENLRELKNPPPRWWTIAFWASVIWWIGYGILYPTWPLGQSANEGLFGWTQMKEYQEGMAELESVRAQYEEQIRGMTAAQILANPELKQYTKASAKVLFGDYCAGCHGSGGQGNAAPSPHENGYPVLQDDDWLYGGTIDKIQETIVLGRKGIMTANLTNNVLNQAEVDQLAHWVVGLREGKPLESDPAAQQLFMTKGCMACHGPEATGMQIMGSANLRSKIWRFAPGGFESARYTIAHGVNDPTDPKSRQAVMPSFKDRLSEHDIKKLAVFVHELGGGK